MNGWGARPLRWLSVLVVFFAVLFLISFVCSFVDCFFFLLLQNTATRSRQIRNNKTQFSLWLSFWSCFPMREFTQNPSNTKGFGRKIAHNSASASCVNWALRADADFVSPSVEISHTFSRQIQPMILLFHDSSVSWALTYFLVEPSCISPESFCLNFFLLSFFLSFFTLFFCAADSSQGPSEEKLIMDIFEKYNKYSRPVKKENESLEVSFGLTLQQIIEVVRETQVHLPVVLQKQLHFFTMRLVPRFKLFHHQRTPLFFVLILFL